MPQDTIQLVIVLDPTIGPISGTFQQQPGGASTRFHGWLQLTEALEAIRQAATTGVTATRAPD